MEKDKCKNVPETIGKLILNGYSVSGGRSISYGKHYIMSEIILKKRYAYYDDNDYLQGFDESIKIDISTGDMEISYSTVENYRRYPSK